MSYIFKQVLLLMLIKISIRPSYKAVIMRSILRIWKLYLDWNKLKWILLIQNPKSDAYPRPDCNLRFETEIEIWSKTRDAPLTPNLTWPWFEFHDPIDLVHKSDPNSTLTNNSRFKPNSRPDIRPWLETKDSTPIWCSRLEFNTLDLTPTLIELIIFFYSFRPILFNIFRISRSK